jgi:hypothetical protein
MLQTCIPARARFSKSLSCLIIYFFTFSGCITTNYYTGRTLEEGETIVTPGVDNLLLITSEEGVVEKDFSFSLSLGAATGLPWRFETGIRAYFPYIWEANIRHQLNPRSFDWFDLSANFHMGVMFSRKFDEVEPPYYKYGLTISKEIFSLQPFVGYYWNNHFEFEGESEFNNFQIVCFGLAIPFKDDLIIPECNYYRSPEGEFSVYSIGIGIRASLDKSTKQTEQKDKISMIKEYINDQ